MRTRNRAANSVQTLTGPRYAGPSSYQRASPHRTIEMSHLPGRRERQNAAELGFSHRQRQDLLVMVELADKFGKAGVDS